MNDESPAEVKAVEKTIQDPQALLAEIGRGLEELIPDEVLRLKVQEWARKRLAEMAMVVMQQSAGIKSLSLVLDDVLTKLRVWGWSADKGWIRARGILNEVLKSWKARSAQDAGDGKQESAEPGSSHERGSEVDHPPATEADGGGEKPLEGMSEG